MLGKPPIQNERFAVVPEHDVGWLQVAMDNSLTVGVGDGLTDADEPPQQLTERLGSRGGMVLGDGLPQRQAPHELHGVVGASGGIASQGVDRHDTGVLELAGDLGLVDEPPPAAGVVGQLGADLLERHLAVQGNVPGDSDQPQPARLVGTEQDKPAGRRGSGDSGETSGWNRANGKGQRAAGAAPSRGSALLGWRGPRNAASRRPRWP